jgi:replication fork protection complex subunit Csm3/Swi3
MSPYGLPALMKEAKRFKVRGKGHEVSILPALDLGMRKGGSFMRILITQAQDLKALLGVYQLWAHQMFPRGDFMGTVTRVENVLRTRRMEVSSLFAVTCCVPLRLPSSVLF